MGTSSYTRFLGKKNKRIDSVLATGPKHWFINTLNKEKALILKPDDDTWPVNSRFPYLVVSQVPAFHSPDPRLGKHLGMPLINY